MIKKYNLSKPKQYVKDGVEKTIWQNIGVMTEFIKDDGSVSRKIEIPAIGLDCQVFPFEDKEVKEAPKTQNRPTPKAMTPEEEYNQFGSKTEMIDEEIVDQNEISY